MAAVVAVEDPVPRALRRPGERHRLRRLQQLGHREAPVGGHVHGVARPARLTLRVDAEVEAVQVHRVVGLREVHEVPPHRVALRQVDALGVRPRQPIDRHRAVAEPRAARRVEREVPRDHEHTVVLRLHPARNVRRVDDDRAVELRVVVEPDVERLGADLAEVVERPRLGGSERHPLRRARCHDDAVSQATRRAESADDERLVERVVQHRLHLCADLHADERPRVLQRLAELGERGDVEALPLRALGEPRAAPRLEVDGQHAVHERAGGAAIVVGNDGLALGGLGGRNERSGGDAPEQQSSHRERADESHTVSGWWVTCYDTIGPYGLRSPGRSRKKSP